MFVRRRNTGPLTDHLIGLPVRFGRGSIMLWGAISARGIELLHTAHQNLRGAAVIDILSHILASTNSLAWQTFSFQEPKSSWNGRCNIISSVWCGLHRVYILILVLNSGVMGREYWGTIIIETLGSKNKTASLK